MLNSGDNELVVLEVDFCLILQAFLATHGWEFDVFICYAGPARAFIAMLHAEMQKYGLKTFTDVKSMEKGSSVEMTVAHAIVKSPFFMVVLSHSFLTSLHCESQVEAALAFPEIHKKIIPVFYEMSVDGCLQTEKELFHRLAAITGLHKGYKTDKQFAESISQEVRQMAVEQLQSSKLPCFFLLEDSCIAQHKWCLIFLQMI